jgi:hypothetical protein
LSSLTQQELKLEARRDFSTSSSPNTISVYRVQNKFYNNSIMGPSTKRRKLNTSAVEEIKFDDNARADYLTGFHKRKLQRIKEAQAQAVKKEKAERLVMREEV